MKEGELSPLEQAYREIPERWYEKQRIDIVMAVGVTALSAWSRLLTLGAPITTHLVAGAIVGLSAIIDYATTIEGLSAQDKGVQNGIPEELTEGRLLLSHVKTADGYRAARKTTLAIDGFRLASSTLVPEIGAGVAAQNLVAHAGLEVQLIIFKPLRNIVRITMFHIFQMPSLKMGC